MNKQCIAVDTGTDSQLRNDYIDRVTFYHMYHVHWSILEKKLPLDAPIKYMHQCLKKCMNERGDSDIERVRILHSHSGVDYRFVLRSIYPQPKNKQIVHLLVDHPCFQKGRHRIQRGFLENLFFKYVANNPPDDMLDLILSYLPLGFSIHFWQQLLKYSVQYGLSYVFKLFRKTLFSQYPRKAIESDMIQYFISSCPESPMFPTAIAAFDEKDDDDPWVHLVVAILTHKADVVKSLLPRCYKPRSCELMSYFRRHPSAEVLDVLLDSHVLDLSDVHTHVEMCSLETTYAFYKVLVRYMSPSEAQHGAILRMLVKHNDLAAIEELVYTHHPSSCALADGLSAAILHTNRTLFDFFYDQGISFVICAYGANHPRVQHNLIAEVLRIQSHDLYGHIKTLPECRLTKIEEEGAHWYVSCKMDHDDC
ncbi:MAG: hypothetical protein K0U52_08295 [Gammaproteobacteria bacterium]|nr:hypothetical protein [Gammaproteobacteria bacterium]